MIIAILSFLRNHWIGALGSAFIIGIAAKLSFQEMEIKHFHKQIIEYSAENQSLENSNKALVSSIQKQNAVFITLQTAQDKKIQTAKHQLGIAKVSANKYFIAAQKIKAQKSGNDECADMRKLVDDAIHIVP